MIAQFTNFSVYMSKLIAARSPKKCRQKTVHASTIKLNAFIIPENQLLWAFCCYMGPSNAFLLSLGDRTMWKMQITEFWCDFTKILVSDWLNLYPILDFRFSLVLALLVDATLKSDCFLPSCFLATAAAWEIVALLMTAHV